jgi:hypothetical protein
MGYNTTILVLNDALDTIEGDPDFGKKLCDAIRSMGVMGGRRRGPVNVPVGNHANPVTVIETHHADQTALIAVGGNCATVFFTTRGSRHGDKEMQYRLSEELDRTVTQRRRDDDG